MRRLVRVAKSQCLRNAAINSVGGPNTNRPVNTRVTRLAGCVSGSSGTPCLSITDFMTCRPPESTATFRQRSREATSRAIRPRSNVPDRPSSVVPSARSLGPQRRYYSAHGQGRLHVRPSTTASGTSHSRSDRADQLDGRGRPHGHRRPAIGRSSSSRHAPNQRRSSARGRGSRTPVTASDPRP
jgi:hypothetical protein